MNTGEIDSAQRWRNLIVVAAIALSLRLLVCVFALQHFGAEWFFHRGTEMGFVARSLTSGQGFGSPFGPPSGPTALIAPAYPLLVAAVFRCAGMFSAGSALVLMAANALLNTASICMVLVLARKLASERAAVIAALIPAWAPPLLWMPSIFWETSFSAFLLLGCISFLAELYSRSTPVRWLGGGLVVGFAGLWNPALLPALGVCGVLASWTSRRAGLMKPMLGVVGFLLIYSAWPIRNELALHAFVPTRTTVGFELWMGNHDGATGYLDESRFPTFNAEELGRYRELGEVGYMAGKSADAKEWIGAHPLMFCVLTVRRVGRFWTGTGTRQGSLAYAVYACLTMVGAMFGLWVQWREGKRSPLVMGLVAALLIFPLPYYLTHAEFRYRLVLDPVLCLLSAVGVDRLLAAYARVIKEVAEQGVGPLGISLGG